jgi:hypothetical protein
MKALVLNITPKEAALLLDALDAKEERLLVEAISVAVGEDDTLDLPEVVALREFIVAAHGLRLALDLGDEA